MSPVDETARRWVERLHLRLAAPGSEGWTDDDRARFIAQREDAIAADTVTLCELLAQHTAQTESRWRTRIHDAEGVDHEMLDESLDFALTHEDP